MLTCCLLLAVLLGTLPVFSAELPKKIQIGKKADLTLTGNNTVIVVEPTASKVTKFAAKELREFLSQILGKKIPVSAKPGKGVNLYVGLGKFAAKKGLNGKDLARDGFFIKRYGKDICIAGRDDPKADSERLIRTSGVWGMQHERASVFAVYDFLERFAGVRFYFPGELGTIVPKKAALKLPQIDIVEKPDFIKRTYSSFYDGEYFEGKNRKAIVNPYKNLNLYRRRASTRVIPCCHGLEHGYNLAGRFFKTHPEYFALTKFGKRHPKHLCWSSPVVEELYQDIKAYLTGRPASERGIGKRWHFAYFIDKYVDIFPSDGMVLCECAKCKAAYEPERGRRNGMATELIWNNVINWAERLKKEKIEGTLCMAAYSPYKELPKRKIPDNVLLMVCTIGAWENDTEAGRKGLALVKAWKEKTGRKVQLWNYAYKGQLSWKMTGVPAYTPMSIGKYYPQVAPYACGVFLESSSDRFLYFYMNNYMLCKLAWDNKADYKAILDEHYRLMYGPAADVMRKILEEFEEICTKKIVGRTIDTPLGPSASVPSDIEIWNRIYSPRKIAEFAARFDRAAKLVKPGSLEAKRIALIRREYLGPMIVESNRFLNRGAMSLRFDMRYPVQLRPYRFDQKKRPELVKTSVQARYTKDALVVTFDCAEPKMGDIKVEKRKADDPEIWRDNSVEIMLNPSTDRKTYYHWIVSSSGLMTDYFCKRVGRSGNRPDSSWNSGATAKVTRNKNSWQAVITIPLKCLANLKKDGFPANFYRNRVLKNSKKHHVLYSWSPYIEGFHDVDNFGSLTPGEKELVYHGGFDYPKMIGRVGGNMGWGQIMNKRFIGWLGPRPSKPMRCERDTKVFFSAPASMRLTSVDPNKRLALSHHFVGKKLKRNTKYRISYMLKMDNVKPARSRSGVALNLVDCQNNFFPRGSWFAGTSDWNRISFVYKTKDKPLRKSCVVEIQMYQCTGTIWVDDISVEEITE